MEECVMCIALKAKLSDTQMDNVKLRIENGRITQMNQNLNEHGKQSVRAYNMITFEKAIMGVKLNLYEDALKNKTEFDYEKLFNKIDAMTEVKE